MFINKMLEVFSRMGVSKNDIVLVSSDISRVINIMSHEYRIKLTSRKEMIKLSNIIIDALQDLVGKGGTLLFPTYNWNFCKGIPWNYNTTPGKTGALSNVALKRQDFIRTKHPIYSFAVWGRDAEYLYNIDNTDSFGLESPFAYMHKHHGKNISIDTTEFFTFIHYVEQCHNVDYRYIKNFESKYIVDDNEYIKTYSMYVRQLDPEVITTLGEVDNRLLFEKGALKCMLVENIPLKTVDLDMAYDVISDDIIYNESKNLIIRL